MVAQAEGPPKPSANRRQDRPACARQSCDTKSVGQGVAELRLPYGPGYRIYFTQRGNRVVLLLCGGDKSTQSDDITRAHQLAADWHLTEEGHDH